MRIGLDFDGVVVDTSGLKFKTAKALYGVEIPSEIFKEPLVVEGGYLTRPQYRTLMNTVCGTREVGLTMPAWDSSVEFITRLLKDGHSIRVITSRENSELDVAKEWCDERGMKELEFVSVGYGKDKLQAASGLEVYVEDDLNKLVPLVGKVPHLFLVSWDYNKSSNEEGIAKRVSSWDELFGDIQKLIYGKKEEEKR